jgi:hypothetical protein
MATLMIKSFPMVISKLPIFTIYLHFIFTRLFFEKGMQIYLDKLLGITITGLGGAQAGFGAAAPKLNS